MQVSKVGELDKEIYNEHINNHVTIEALAETYNYSARQIYRIIHKVREQEGVVSYGELMQINSIRMPNCYLVGCKTAEEIDLAYLAISCFENGRAIGSCCRIDLSSWYRDHEYQRKIKDKTAYDLENVRLRRDDDQSIWIGNSDIRLFDKVVFRKNIIECTLSTDTVLLLLLTGACCVD